jgi:hypothetical protein
MSTKKIACYVRTLRRQWGLTQEDVSFLLPKGDRDRVSRVERGLALPNADEIVAYQLIFGSSAEEAFPRFYDTIEDVVIQRAYQLYERLKAQGSKATARKRKLIESMFERVTGKTSDAGV